MLNTFARWIVLSSTNPQQVSLTIKGVLVGTIPTLILLGGLTNVNVGQEDLNGLFDGIATIVQLILALVSALMTGYGMLRKILNTFFPPKAE